MTPFNPENKESLTYTEALAPAMTITEQADADQYLAAYIAYTEKFSPFEGGKTAEDVAKINLGYYAGYYGSDVQERVNRLFLTKHPIFD